MRFESFIQLPDFVDNLNLYNKIITNVGDLEKMAGTHGLYNWWHLVSAISGVGMDDEEPDYDRIEEANSLLIRGLPGLIQHGRIRHLIGGRLDGQTPYLNYYRVALSETHLDDQDLFSINQFLAEDGKVDCFKVLLALNIDYDREYYLEDLYSAISDLDVTVHLFCEIIMPILCKAGFLRVAIEDNDFAAPDTTYSLSNLN